MRPADRFDATRSPYARALDDLSLDAHEEDRSIELDREHDRESSQPALMHSLRVPCGAEDPVAMTDARTRRALDEVPVPNPASEADSAEPNSPGMEATAADPGPHRALVDHHHKQGRAA